MTQRMVGKTVLITGGTNGIGLETARGLAKMGARVMIVGRNPEKTARVAAEIGAAGTLLADLSELAQVSRAAAEFREREDRLDVLVNNAGALYSRRQETNEGIEMTWALNHLAPFLLTRELLPLLRRAQTPRVVTVSSVAHRFARLNFDDPQFRRGYNGWRAYGQSKLANLLFALELARREPDILSHSVHPGFVRSGFGQDMTGLEARLFRLSNRFHLADRFTVTPEQGAQTSLRVASDPSLLVSGRYFVNERMAQPARQALDGDAARRLWQLSEEAVGP
ncbi:SDR family oxidoreductase [Deinococcus hopiensis]|uniref:NAD(P)-dependent dehydrogenase, short-chain alcohol dehydrogenase family n=1 Tax=Deinococcus hopiensis KR-140 TaxID=695939 RepID=A0A1W1VWG5_9DEIO|nr:SDR family oxidoreductase [Deinococcus hopiensis]SMB97668.1 NAD(P)-dependent dehydrogenase, short-chain alcohol dehydrogenase family [Deinococcus hopiensis KR-140]